MTSPITEAVQALDAEALRFAITDAELDGEPIECLLDQATSALTTLMESA